MSLLFFVEKTTNQKQKTNQAKSEQPCHLRPANSAWGNSIETIIVQRCEFDEAAIGSAIPMDAGGVDTGNDEAASLGSEMIPQLMNMVLEIRKKQEAGMPLLPLKYVGNFEPVVVPGFELSCWIFEGGRVHHLIGENWKIGKFKRTN